MCKQTTAVSMESDLGENSTFWVLKGSALEDDLEILVFMYNSYVKATEKEIILLI